MSTKVELQPVSTQNNNNADDTADPTDQSATPPIILHFLQEASKLAPSHRGLVDSTFDPYASETTKEPRTSSDASDAYSRHGWAQPLSRNGEENRDMYVITTHVGPRLPGSNPWEVMSLINLQCEKLLHRSQQGDSTSTSFSSSSSSGSNSVADRSPSESEDRPQGDRGKPKGSPRETSCLTDTTGGSGEASRESLADCPVQRSTTTSAITSGLSESVRPIPVDRDVVSRFQSAHRAGTGVRWRVVPGSREGPVSAEWGAQSGTSSDRTHLSLAATDDAQRLVHYSNTVVGFAHNSVSAEDPLPADGPAVALDLNSNLLLTFDPLADAHTLPKRPVWAVLSHDELSQNKSQPNGKTTVPECMRDHTDHNARWPSTTQQSHSNWFRDTETTALQRSIPPPTAGS